MNFSILSVAYPFSPVKSNCSGGAEQIVLAIDSKLTELGHHSSVIGTADSKISGHLIKIPAIAHCITDAFKKEQYKTVKIAIEKIIIDQKPDLIHYHGLDFYNYIPCKTIPSLVTLHLPIEWYPVHELDRAMKMYRFNFVSKAQRDSAPLLMRHYPVVQNGIKIVELECINVSVNDYLLCVGRICPEKGFDIGLKIAKKLKMPLLIAGRVFPYESHIAYFKEKIIPEIDGIDYKFLGEVDVNEKRKLMSNAKCILITSQVDETSSLVAMESLSCGTPVVAFNRGALSSIVDDGKTGFVCNTEEDMATAISKIDAIDRMHCFETAKKKFSSDEMVRKYIELYKELI